ncbi:MAG: PKD domain-containing protein [Bacteroidota bacterium]
MVFAPVLPNLSVFDVGGTAGSSFNSSSCGNSSNGAEDGGNGSVELVSDIAQGSEINTAPTVTMPTDTLRLCQSSDTTLAPAITGFDLTYQWQIFNGVSYTPLIDNATISGTATESVQITVNTLFFDGAQIRLAVISDCFGLVASDPIVFSVTEAPQAVFSGDLNGFTLELDNQSLNAEDVMWNFGDSQTSNETSPNHTFPGPGTYNVSLTVTNGCGADTTNELITVGAPPVAGFSNSSSSSCAPLSVSFFNESTGDIDSLRWDFPGGQPSTSTETEPVITYANAGEYDVSLSVYGPGGEATFTQTEWIEVFPTPTPGFTLTQDGATVILTNTSQQAVNFNWNFGDGTTSTDVNPTHTYTESGLYTITLNALNNSCGRTITQLVNIVITATEAALVEEISLFPNPTSGIVYLEGGLGLSIVGVYDAQGRLVASPKTAAGQITRQLNLSHLADGVYWIGIKADDQVVFKSIVKE